MTVEKLISEYESRKSQYEKDVDDAKKKLSKVRSRIKNTNELFRDGDYLDATEDRKIADAKWMLCVQIISDLEQLIQ